MLLRTSKVQAINLYHMLNVVGSLCGKLARFTPRWMFVLGVLAPLAGLAQTAPTNDMFASPIVISNYTGSILGSNVSATTESGEDTNGPAKYFPSLSSASVWYSWTAPSDGPVMFNIADAYTDYDPTVPLDTYLSVYEGTNLTNAVEITANNDYKPNPCPQWSRVSFTAKKGTNYMICVDSWPYDTGTFTLQWGGFSYSRNAGALKFASSRVGNYFGAQSMYVAGTDDNGMARMTVTRTGGYTGRIRVDYALTNTTYINYFGTNVFMTNTVAQVVTDTATNLANTVVGSIYVVHGYANNDHGRIVYAYDVTVTPFATNINTGPYTNGTYRGTNFLGGVVDAGVCTSNYPAGFPGLFGGFVPGGGDSLGNADTNGAVTNIFRSGWVIAPNVVPSAIPGQDYTPVSGVTLTFDDFEMSQDIFPGIPTTSSFGPDYPDHPGINPTVICVLSNPRLAPLESMDLNNTQTVLSDIAPPTIAENVAALNILNKDVLPTASVCDTPPPILNFQQATYVVSPRVMFVNGTTVWVQRTGGGAACRCVYHTDWLGNTDTYNDFPQEAGSDYALRDVDFTSVSGELSWGAGDYTPKPIHIPIKFNQSMVEFNRDVIVQIYSVPQDPGVIGNISTANLTILFDSGFGGPQPAGAVDRTFNPDYDQNNTKGAYHMSLSDPPANAYPGANGPVYAVAVQPDGRCVIGGNFTTYNGYTNNYRIARVTTDLYADGFLDKSFITDKGADAAVKAIAVDANSKILIGGNFTSFNGIGRYHIARLNANGALDPTFNPGSGVKYSLAVDPTETTVEALAVQPDGKIVIGGKFDSYNGFPCHNIARLNDDGSFDTNFNATLGTDGTIHALAIQSSGNIVVGGEFDNAGGAPRSRLARFDSTGKIDPLFSVSGSGINGIVFSLATQLDNNIVIGGSFTMINGVTNNFIGRIRGADGKLDPNFDVGTGADDVVYSVVMQPDGKILIGGQFTFINQTRRVGLARLLPYGPVDTTFMDTAYNQFAGLINHYANPAAVDLADEPAEYNTRNYVKCMAVESTGNILIGGGFARVGGGLTRDDARNRSNFTRVIGGTTWGPGNIELMQTFYSADEGYGERQTLISLTRTNGSLGPVAVSFANSSVIGDTGAIKPGDWSQQPQTPTWPMFYNARPGFVTANYLPHPDYGWQRSDGEFGPNFNNLPTGHTTASTFLTIIGNNIADGNRQGLLNLFAPQQADVFFLAGQNIPTGAALGRSHAIFQINDDDSNAGVIGFGPTKYAFNEGAGTVTITLVRSNGSSGLVSVKWSTADGTNSGSILGAISPIDYYGSVSNTVTFKDGDTTASFTVRLKDNNVIQQDKFFTIKLTDPTGGASLNTNASTAIVTIIDDDVHCGHLDFLSTNFVVSELSTSAVVTVIRRGGTEGSIDVQCSATEDTAINNINFRVVTNTLHWDRNDSTPQTMTIPIIHDSAVTPDRTVTLSLFNPIVAGITNNPTNSLVLAYGHGAPSKLTILNQDSYGKFAFSSPSYKIMENSGVATVTVVRQYGSIGVETIGYRTVNGSAISTNNYLGATNTLTFDQGEISKNFSIPLCDDSVANADRTLSVVLFDPGTHNLLVPPAGAQLVTNATITIVDDETLHEPAGSVDVTYSVGEGFNASVLTMAKQIDGKIVAGGDFTFVNTKERGHVARLNTDGSVDETFLAGYSGADDTVRAVLCQQPDPSLPSTNGLILIGGDFTTVNGVNQGHLARFFDDGRLDESLQIGSGADSSVFAIAETFTPLGFTNFNRNILIAGSFLNYNGVPRNGIARLNNDGSLDQSFDPGLGGGGLNSTIYAMAVQLDGKILIGGNFTTYDNLPYSHLARLNADGTLDQTFANCLAGDSIRAITVQPDGKILIGGMFTNLHGAAFNHIARLNPNGSLDTSFNVGLGANDSVLAIQLDPQGHILVGGTFSRASGVIRNRITQLNPDGTVDSGINFGSGADDFVSSIVVQNDGNIVVAGGFNTFDTKVSPRLVRLYGGTMIGSGNLEFDASNYQVIENQTGVTITIRRRNATFSTVSCDCWTSDGVVGNSAVAGRDYVGYTNRLVFAQGESIKSFTIPIIDNYVADGNRSCMIKMANFSPADAYGNQTTATLAILDDECAVKFAAPAYRVNENDPLGAARIELVRIGGASLPMSVELVTVPGGTAQPGVRYVPVTNLVQFASGETSKFAPIPIIDDTTFIGDQTVVLALRNPVGGAITESTTATLTIVEDDLLAAGMLMFQPAEYAINETNISQTVSVAIVRTNGIKGNISVAYATYDGTATNGLQYTAVSNRVTFLEGETIKHVDIPIKADHLALGDTFFRLVLSDPNGTIIYGTNAAIITIHDAETGVRFPPSGFITVGEKDGSVSVPIQRIGSGAGEFWVRVTSSDDSAIAGVNYKAVDMTNHFGPNQPLMSLSIPIYSDGKVTTNHSFRLKLSIVPDPRSIPVQLVNSTNLTVIINEGDSSYSFATNAFTVAESGNGTVTNALITVLRYGDSSQIGSVRFATYDMTNVAGVNPALAGVNYIRTNGTLYFAPFVTSNSFLVPLIPENKVEGDHAVGLVLSNAVNGLLLDSASTPTNAVLTIIDMDTSINFSSPTYTATKCDGYIDITVVRKGITNRADSVNYSTANGTDSAGRYNPASGTLYFAPGETQKTFRIEIVDKFNAGGGLSPDCTVLLNLSNPSAGATIPSDTSFAILTIVECHGTYVVAAGKALIDESYTPKNGVIDTNEIVTVKLGLRTPFASTTNLVATLLATNGVAHTNNPLALTVAQATYGALEKNGHSIAKPFTFKAVGTNGQTITAWLRLEDRSDNSTNYNFDLIPFSFTIGSTSYSLTNSAAIVINDATPSSNTVAISTITVPEMDQNICGLSVNLYGLKHSYAKDVSVLLVSPQQTKVVLMSHCGNNTSIPGVNLTFNDSALAYLPEFGSIVSGTNKPSAYGFYNSVFVPVAPAGPYGTNLSALFGSNPKGVWTLYVADDNIVNSGIISNGWSLSFKVGLPVNPEVDLGLTAIQSAAPYIVSNNVTYTVTVTNYGPAQATNVVLTDILPAFAKLVSIPTTTYSVSSNGVMTCSLGTLPMPTPNGNDYIYYGTSFNYTIMLGTNGSATNVISVKADQTDLNFGNNSVTNFMQVINPQADLDVAIDVVKNLVYLGDLVTYNISVINRGPSKATGITLTDLLPPEVSFVSCTLNSGLTNGLLTVYLKDLDVNEQLNLSIVAKAMLTSDIGFYNAVEVDSPLDLLKANNNPTSPKVVVKPVSMSLVRGTDNCITWPISGSYTLMTTTNLVPPVIWVPVTNTVDCVNGQNSVKVILTNRNQFFRLQSN